MKIRKAPAFLRTLLLAAGLLAASTAARAQVSCAGVSPWSDCCNCAYKAGQLVIFDGTLYHAAQSFTNTCSAGWKPSLAPSLWTLNGTCVAASPAAMPRNRQAPTPSATAPPVSSTPGAPSTPMPTSTATPAGVYVAVQGSHNCDGMQQFLVLRWNTEPPYMGSSEYRIGFSATSGGPYAPKIIGSQAGSVYTTVSLDALPGCSMAGNACASYIAVATGGAYSSEVRGEMISPACSSPPPPPPASGPMPGPVRGLMATDGSDTCDGFYVPIVLSWRPLPGARYYNVYRAEPGTSSFEPMAFYVPGTSYAVPVRGAADFVVYGVNQSEITPGTRILGRWTRPTCPGPTPTVPGWRPGVTYFVGTVVTYAEGTYKSLQTHASQLGWEPPNAPTLWGRQ